MNSPTSPPPAPRVAVVTGATSGIGKEVARGLAAQGFTTVVVGRGADRTAAVAAELAAATGNPRVESLGVGDLAVRAEMKTLASQLLNRYPEIHLLVNNAGAFFVRRELTSDGIERTFALNVLAPFALTTLLADRMRVSAPARVVEVASTAHRGRTVPIDDLQHSARYEGYRAYGESKLELILLSREFARRLAGTGVTVNAVHPGFIRSGFGLNNGGGVGFGMRLVQLVFAHGLQYGADNVLYAATDPTIATVTGEYLSRHRVDRASPTSYDMAMARRLYDACRQWSETPELPDPGPPAPASVPAPSAPVPATAH
jgi:NAD(P)-dependent dehydrogenase (short-subunit alcohol dehydrogenase family)